DGRYGVFEILKHVAPGIVCDLAVPLAVRGGRVPGALGWCTVGGVMGMARFATIFTVTLAVQPPALAWAILIPGFAIHTTFGALSGLVCVPLVKAVARREAQEAERYSDETDRRPDPRRADVPLETERP